MSLINHAACNVLKSDLQSCVVAGADVSDHMVDAVVDGRGGLAHHSQNSPVALVPRANEPPDL